MNAARILTQAQAKAAYDALCAVNNLGGPARIKVWNIADHDLFGMLSLHESMGNHIVISNGSRIVEHHDSQAAFVTAYNLV